MNYIRFFICFLCVSLNPLFAREAVINPSDPFEFKHNVMDNRMFVHINGTRVHEYENWDEDLKRKILDNLGLNRINASTLNKKIKINLETGNISLISLESQSNDLTKCLAQKENLEEILSHHMIGANQGARFQSGYPASESNIDNSSSLGLSLGLSGTLR